MKTKKMKKENQYESNENAKIENNENMKAAKMKKIWKSARKKAENIKWRKYLNEKKYESNDGWKEEIMAIWK